MTEGHAAKLYDGVNSWGADDEFFLRFATENPEARVLDLGCGTGRITTIIAGHVDSVTGIDPDGSRIEAARRKSGGPGVEWIVGDSGDIPVDRLFDRAIMSANVIQEILDDAVLARTFSDLFAHFAPGSQLAFDSRDPQARGWEQWTKERSHKIVDLPEGRTEHWYQTTAVDEPSGLVDFRAHQVDATGKETSGSARLRFRSEEHLRSMLTEAGFEVDEVFGGFQGEAVGQGMGSLVFIASR